MPATLVGRPPVTSYNHFHSISKQKGPAVCSTGGSGQTLLRDDYGISICTLRSSSNLIVPTSPPRLSRRHQPQCRDRC